MPLWRQDVGLWALLLGLRGQLALTLRWRRVRLKKQSHHNPGNKRVPGIEGTEGGSLPDCLLARGTGGRSCRPPHLSCGFPGFSVVVGGTWVSFSSPGSEGAWPCVCECTCVTECVCVSVSVTAGDPASRCEGQDGALEPLASPRCGGPEDSVLSGPVCPSLFVWALAPAHATQEMPTGTGSSSPKSTWWRGRGGLDLNLGPPGCLEALPGAGSPAVLGQEATVKASPGSGAWGAGPAAPVPLLRLPRAALLTTGCGCGQCVPQARAVDGPGWLWEPWQAQEGSSRASSVLGTEGLAGSL